MRTRVRPIVVSVILALLLLHQVHGVHAQQADTTAEQVPVEPGGIEGGETNLEVYVIVGAAMGFIGSYAWGRCINYVCLLGTAIGAFVGYSVGVHDRSREEPAPVRNDFGESGCLPDGALSNPKVPQRRLLRMTPIPCSTNRARDGLWTEVEVLSIMRSSGR